MAAARNASIKQVSTQAGIAGDGLANAGSPGEKAAAAPAPKRAAAAKIMPTNPERKQPGAERRKRLSKAFARPLDKKRNKETFVRDRFTLPASDYALLVELKKRLAEQGVAVKKSELIRAGLRLLIELDENAVKATLASLDTAA